MIGCIQHYATLLYTRHTKDAEFLHRARHIRIIAVVCIRAIQDDGCDVVLVVRVLEGFGSIKIPVVIRGIAANVGDVFDGEVGKGGVGRVVEVPR